MAETTSHRRRVRWMAIFFAAGSTCFLVGPFPGFLSLVGPQADGATLFAGSVLFTAGGALQSLLATPGRHRPPHGGAAWWAALIQSLGTLCFNVTTFRALHVTITDPAYNSLVWRPDAVGSICFLVSGFMLYYAGSRRGWRPARGTEGWWEPPVNLLGCVLFGVSAVAGHVVPTTGSVLDLAAANWTTCLGAACFLACAAASLRTGRTAKAPRDRLRRLEEDVEREVQRLA